ncbi:hypothetical protein BAUCODRAFT_230685 [Baudoinia panamericana UAMH 10762]|uniref:Uncharacterized protein n=1 Tax=Baudoinia panamericana (strain UAMH 10762) TaxID=717646 RepID=M2MNZ7_BAUPA|nr:uncharacterized protein BAUCODRAFT_230685 [Baudoinia panamericana UAMH 10762]EMC93188.1 hypothetical protein BAUCODRAFT_230685 [Baudoinia panamericana UAMH 10762]
MDYRQRFGITFAAASIPGGFIAYLSSFPGESGPMAPLWPYLSLILSIFVLGATIALCIHVTHESPAKNPWDCNPWLMMAIVTDSVVAALHSASLHGLTQQAATGGFHISGASSLPPGRPQTRLSVCFCCTELRREGWGMRLCENHMQKCAE